MGIRDHTNTSRNLKIKKFTENVLLDGGTSINLNMKLIFGIHASFVVIINNLYTAFSFKRVDIF